MYLEVQAKYFLLLLKSLADEEGKVCMSLRQLTKETGYGERHTIAKGLQFLEDAGAITIERRKKNNAFVENIYTVVDYKKDVTLRNVSSNA